MDVTIREFVQRELELKEKLPFGEWIRHIKDSHVELLHMLQNEVAPRTDQPLSVVLVDHQSEPPRCARFQVCGATKRLIIGLDPATPTVQSVEGDGASERIENIALGDWVPLLVLIGVGTPGAGCLDVAPRTDD